MEQVRPPVHSEFEPDSHGKVVAAPAENQAAYGSSLAVNSGIDAGDARNGNSERGVSKSPTPSSQLDDSYSTPATSPDGPKDDDSSHEASVAHKSMAQSASTGSIRVQLAANNATSTSASTSRSSAAYTRTSSPGGSPSLPNQPPPPLSRRASSRVSRASSTASSIRRRSSGYQQGSSDVRPPPSRRSSVEGPLPDDVQSVRLAESDYEPAKSQDPQVASDLPVIVRDFAFPRDDPRFQGQPHPAELEMERKRRSERVASQYSELDASSPGFSWGFVTSHSADFSADSEAKTHHSPRRQHLSGTLDSGDDDFDEDEDDYDDYSSDERAADPTATVFTPGIYQALYDFEPEMDTEMRIEVGEVVTVLTRQCAGWVQAGRVADGQITGEVGLVPENYLQILQAHDGEEEAGLEGEETGSGVENVHAGLVDEKELGLIEETEEVNTAVLTTDNSASPAKASVTVDQLEEKVIIDEEPIRTAVE